jgi:sialic acid synthase SpsE
MAKQKAIANIYDGPRTVADKWESKYFKYLGSLRDTSRDIIVALGTHDIQEIKQAIKDLANSINNHVVLIGLDCVIIDRE